MVRLRLKTINMFHDDEFKMWLGAACLVGQQDHLRLMIVHSVEY
jgi:hypothetical protein